MPGAPFISDQFDTPLPSAHDPLRSPSGGMTIYDLLRHLCDAARWGSYDELRDAQALIDQIEEIALFGSLAENYKSMRRDTNV